MAMSALSVRNVAVRVSLLSEIGEGEVVKCACGCDLRNVALRLGLGLRQHCTAH